MKIGLFNGLFGERPLTKSALREMKGDYIPGGKSVDINTLQFRRTEETELLRCCCQVGNDIQSGPIFCGDIAEYVAEDDTGVVALCERHSPPERLREQSEFKFK